MRRKLFRSFLPVLLISAVFHFPIASSFARAHSFQRSVVLSTSSSGAMSSSAMSSPETPTQNTHTIDTEEREEPVWDPVAQIYVGGKVPENAEVAKTTTELCAYLVTGRFAGIQARVLWRIRLSNILWDEHVDTGGVGPSEVPIIAAVLPFRALCVRSSRTKNIDRFENSIRLWKKR
jgi:hypothetical protein